MITLLLELIFLPAIHTCLHTHTRTHKHTQTNIRRHRGICIYKSQISLGAGVVGNRVKKFKLVFTGIELSSGLSMENYIRKGTLFCACCDPCKNIYLHGPWRIYNVCVYNWNSCNMEWEQLGIKGTMQAKLSLSIVHVSTICKGVAKLFIFWEIFCQILLSWGHFPHHRSIIQEGVTQQCMGTIKAEILSTLT